MGIRNFKHKRLGEFFTHLEDAKIGDRYARAARQILDTLARMTKPDDCKGIRNFHELKGRRKGTYSMHVNGNYCITFKWDGYDAYDVNFEDYH